MNQQNHLQSGWLLYGVNVMSTIRSIHMYYESYRFSYHYRPQRNCGKVMFLHLSVCHSVHRGRHAWGAVRGGGMRGRGVRMGGGMHVDKGGGWGGSVCMVGETAIAAGGTRPTGMHSCFQSSFSQFSQKWQI